MIGVRVVAAMTLYLRVSHKMPVTTARSQIKWASLLHFARRPASQTSSGSAIAMYLANIECETLGITRAYQSAIVPIGRAARQLSIGGVNLVRTSDRWSTRIHSTGSPMPLLTCILLGCRLEHRGSPSRVRGAEG